jgi:hypothetical protein
MELWILDENKNVVLTRDIRKVERWVKNFDLRIVGKDKVEISGVTTEVSTVLLFNPSGPYHFETMVFCDPEIVYRYKTYAEALAGHKTTVESLQPPHPYDEFTLYRYCTAILSNQDCFAVLPEGDSGDGFVLEVSKVFESWGVPSSQEKGTIMVGEVGTQVHPDVWAIHKFWFCEKENS